MWFDEIDDRIRNAAENNTPAYDDKTWLGMDALLNKHLPQKRKRRGGFIFFLLLGLLLFIPGIFIAKKFSSGNKTTAKENTFSTAASTGNTQDHKNTIATGKKGDIGKAGSNGTEATTTTTSLTTDVPVSNKQGVSPVTGAARTVNDNVINIGINNAGIGNSNDPVANKTALKKNRPAGENAAGSNTFDISNPSISSANKMKPVTEPVTPIPSTQVVGPVTKNATGENEVNNFTKPTAKNTTAITTVAAGEKQPLITSKADSAGIAAKPTEKKNEQPLKSKGNKLSITFSLGPDMSKVGTSKMGKVESVYGIGAAYAVTKRIMVRAGFYAGKKIYSADSMDYHLPYNPGSGFYKLSNIAADCFVYEIPVTAVYSFKTSGKHNWFVSAGLSSYIMKKETYVYNFKTPGGQVYSYNHEFKNENKHFFSVINLSGGYQYNFSKRFSLLAEPYLKLPLKGVGEGKVKLNSGGILFTVAIRPFAK